MRFSVVSGKFTLQASWITEVELVMSQGLTAGRPCGITGACGIHKEAG